MTPAFFLIPYLAELAFIFPVNSGKLSLDTFSMFHQQASWVQEP